MPKPYIRIGTRASEVILWKGSRIESQDVWIYVVTKLYAVALVCCVSMSDAWKWAIAFSLGMAVLVAVCQPYMWPQAKLNLTTFQRFKNCIMFRAKTIAFEG